MTAQYTYYATTPRGLAPVLAEELRQLGAETVREARAGASFTGSLSVGYRACLWSRSAGRVLLQLAEFPAPDAEALYSGVRALSWRDHLAPDGSLAVDCAASGSPLTNSHYAALKVKDAVVDQLREQTGERPRVDRVRPQVRLNLFLRGEQAELRLDLSGENLHRRHYRGPGAPAPLKENLAAGLLLLAGWPERAAAGGSFVDLMCGSGTLPIEAALISLDLAPGLERDYWGFTGWRGHDPACFAVLQAEARQRALEGRQQRRALIVGLDADGQAIASAQRNAARAGVNALVQLRQQELSQAGPPPGSSEGLLLVNPPYGQRLGHEQGLVPLYTALGDLLKQRFSGWDAYLLSGSPTLARFIGLRPQRRIVVYNGELECRLLHYPLVQGSMRRQPATPDAAPVSAERGLLASEEQGHAGFPLLASEEQDALLASGEEGEEGSPLLANEAAMFAGRLQKNLRNLRRWARREQISCYRVYDADLPQFAVAVDLYENWVHVQEYAPPRSVSPQAASRRLRQVLSQIPQVLQISPKDLFLKVRRRQPRGEQYAKLPGDGACREVREGGLRFWVNLSDYLDTGLFLDQRQTRALIGQLAAGRRFLNLFAYTATATVYAARGGATRSVSVDLSNHYLDWAAKNFALNELRGDHHQLVRADCLQWLAQHQERYDLIFLDPPTHSNSKAMKQDLDIQRDHVRLVRACLRLLSPSGLLLFSTNFQKFRIDGEAVADLQLENWSHKTLPRDFVRTPKIHQIWCISRRL